MIPFFKYQGTGNDFIIIDNRKRQYDHLDVAKLCHPKFGIGGDGLMLLQNREGYDFEMVYYNSDGKLSSMCGNGGRCIVDFAKHLGVFKGSETNFIAVDGAHQAKWMDHYVELQMKDVNGIEKIDDNTFVLNTGSPHYVHFTNDISDINIIEVAHRVRYNERFKAEGINVNFVEVIGQNHIKVRTYERGVENETLSCGTGVTASAIALSVLKNMENGEHRIHIETPGGDLMVRYSSGDAYKNVWLCGPATMVYTGEIAG